MSPTPEQLASFMRKRNEHVKTLTRWSSRLETTLPENEDMHSMLLTMASDVLTFKALQYRDTCKIWTYRCNEIASALLATRTAIAAEHQLSEYLSNRMRVLVVQVGRLTPNGLDYAGDSLAAEWAQSGSSQYRMFAANGGLIQEPDGSDIEEAWNGLHLFDKNCPCLQCRGLADDP